MRICYAECPYNCMEDDLGWSDTVDMFCNHPNNDRADCYFYNLFLIDIFLNIREYIELAHKKINCPFVKQKFAKSDLFKDYPGEKMIINDKGDWVYEL